MVKHVSNKTKKSGRLIRGHRKKGVRLGRLPKKKLIKRRRRRKKIVMTPMVMSLLKKYLKPGARRIL